MINSFKNPAIMRILRTTERHGAGWREQNFIPDNEAAGQLKWLRTPLRQSGAGVFFLSPTCQMPHRIVYLAHNIPARCVQ